MKTYTQNTLQTVWIIVLNWNGKHHLKYCLPSLLNSNLNDACILIVDNGSTDGSIDFINNNFKEQVLILALDENKGWAGGNNAGACFAATHGAEYIVFLNNDMMFSKHWLDESMRVFSIEKDAGIVGCSLCYSEREFEDAQHNWIEMSYSPKSHVSGCSMIVSTKVMYAIGLFDEELFIYGEEDDFEHRALASGFLMFVTNTPLWHCEEGTMGNLLRRKSYLAMRNTMIFYRRHKNVWMFPVLVTHIFICALLKNYRNHAISNRRYHTLSPLKNLGILFSALSWNICDTCKRGWKAHKTFAKLPPLDK